MEAYVLDSLLRRTEVVDKFESFIWTERFAESGDFEIVMPSNRDNRSRLTEGTLLAMNRSYRVMRIDTVEDKVDSDGKAVLSVKGKSLEDLLTDRIIRGAIVDTVTEPYATITEVPDRVAWGMFWYACILGTLDPGDKIPFIQTGVLLSPGNLPFPIAEIDWTQKPDLLYNAIKEICDQYEMGFRLIRNFDASELYFEIYMGNDLTTRQTVFPPVVFARGFDNLENTTDFRTTVGSKNVAYVLSDFGAAIVYPDNVDPDTEGFERRVLLVTTSDVKADSPDIPGDLQRIGKAELLKNRSQHAFDGELNQYSQFQYGIDYNLGDIVELRDNDGVLSNRRVTEQIFVCDGEGERSYPTLTTEMFIAANTWRSWPSNQPWEELGATQYWADQ